MIFFKVRGIFLGAFLSTFIYKKIKRSYRYVFPYRGFSPSIQPNIGFCLLALLAALLLRLVSVGLLTIKHCPVFMHRCFTSASFLTAFQLLSLSDSGLGLTCPEQHRADMHLSLLPSHNDLLGSCQHSPKN